MPPGDYLKLMSIDSFVVIIGVVMIVEGIPWFLSPPGARRVLAQLFRQDDRLLRLMGLGFMLGGLLLVFLAKR